MTADQGHDEQCWVRPVWADQLDQNGYSGAPVS